MTSKEKKDCLFKEVIKPQLKIAGYQMAGQNYYSVRDDCCLAIRIHSSQFNSAATGFGFWFQITAFPKDVSKETLKGEFFGEVFTEREMLPDCGYLHPYRDARGYLIDAYKNGSPQDMNLEDIKKRIGDDLCQYILPQLESIKTFEDWEKQKEEGTKKFNTQRVKLLRYFSGAQIQYLDFDERSFSALMLMRKSIEISAEEIKENQLLYKQIKVFSDSPAEDKWKIIVAALDAEKDVIGFAEQQLQREIRKDHR